MSCDERFYAARTNQERADMHLTGMRSPIHQQTAMDGRVCALGNQNVHGNTWVMNGATWISTR